MLKRGILSLLLALSWAGADAHVLVYHRFDEPDRASTHISTAKLREQFEYFRQNGYEIVPLSRLILALEGAEPIGQKWVVLSIDDGYKSFYEKALPIFKEFGYPFVLFVYAEASQDKYGDYMSFSQIKEASNYGEIGLHSYAHPHLLRLSDDEVRRDFERGVKTFEKAMGYSPIYYAYPYGEYDERIQKIAREFKFKAIFNQNTGAIAKDSPLDDLDRTPISELTPIRFALASEYLPATWSVSPHNGRAGRLSSVSVKTPFKANKAEFFISTSAGYVPVDLKDGSFTYRLNPPLRRYSTRVSLKIGHKTATKIFTKDHYAK